MRSNLLHFLALTALGAASALSASCSKSDTSPVADGAAGDDDAGDTRPPTPPAWDAPVTRPDDATSTSSRAACTYKRGQMPAETLGPATKVDADIPIKHVIVLMQENRSFDHYLGHFAKFAGRTDIESAPDTASNPDVPGGATGAHPWKHADHLCNLDVNHTWKGQHNSWSGGKNDGFYDSSNAKDDHGAAIDAGANNDGERAMWWYDERDIPFEYALAQSFAIGDHYFSSVLGPTYPNRMYLYGANSYGITDNVLADLSAFPYPDKDAVIFDELEKRHTDWMLYTDGSPGAGVILGVGLVSRYHKTPVKRVADFIQQMADGTLPAVAFVDGGLGSAEGPQGTDEHPPSQIQIGQDFIYSIVKAVTTSPLWKDSVLFITYDENGGFYDHVAPPKACAPDGTAPVLHGSDVGVAGDFTQYGFRVPITIVSPYAKKGYVSHATYDHASITRFIEAKFKVPAISNRDANADPFTDVFDWQNPPQMTAPTFTEPTVDPTEVQYCVTNFPK